MISVVLKTYIQIKKNKETNLFKSYRKLYKDGEQKRDFIYVKDCIKTLLWFLENKRGKLGRLLAIKPSNLGQFWQF